jgi:hypothetical protein
MSFMSPPRVIFRTVIDADAKFDQQNWTCNIEAARLRNDVTADEFEELCNAAYHESRHAEQYFRIAQGLACGQLKNPNSEKKFSTVHTFRAAEIAQLLGMHGAIAQIADNLRDGFKEFAALPVGRNFEYAMPSWGEQAGEWLECLCKRSRVELTEFSETSSKKVALLLYRKLPVEVDALHIGDLAGGGILWEIDPKDLYTKTPRSKVPPNLPSKRHPPLAHHPKMPHPPLSRHPKN